MGKVPLATRIARDDLADRVEDLADEVRTGEAVGMVGCVVYKDGVCRFGLGGKAAESHGLAVEMCQQLCKRVVDMLQ